MARSTSRNGKNWRRLYNRLCQVERLEQRVLLTGGLNLGEYALGTAPLDAQQPAAEATLAAARTQPVRDRTAAPEGRDLPELPGNRAEEGVHLPEAVPEGPSQPSTQPSPQPGRHEGSSGEDELESGDRSSEPDDIALAPVDEDPEQGPITSTETGKAADPFQRENPAAPPPTDLPSGSDQDDRATPATLLLLPGPASGSSAAPETAAPTAVAGQSASVPAFRYFEESAAPTHLPVPSLTGRPLALHSAQDAFMDLALLPLPSKDTSPAAGEPSMVSSLTHVRWAARMRLVATSEPRSIVSAVALARAEHVLRSVDAVLAEMGEELNPSETEISPPSLEAQVAESSGVESDNREPSGKEPAGQCTLRLGFLALGSLVLSSRWAVPPATVSSIPLPRLRCRLTAFLARLKLSEVRVERNGQRS